MEAGTTGLIFGRNIWQCEHGESLRFITGSGTSWPSTHPGDALTVPDWPGGWRDSAAAAGGGSRRHRLSLRGNRRLNHAIHMAAITQIRHAHSEGRAYYERKIAEGKTHKEALRCLKRRISDAIYARLRADARHAAAAASKDPGGQPGNDSDSSAAGSHPEHRLFGQATPGPDTSLRATTAPTSAMPPSEPPAKKPRRAT